MVAALITLLMPGAGPPPTKIASFSLDTLNNSLLLFAGRGRTLA
jgi:hypothetical protein